MRSGFFYPLQADNKTKVNGFRYIKAFLLAGVMLVSMAVNARTTGGSSPQFVNGSPQAATLCENGFSDITSLLVVNDPAGGKTETWSSTTPLHGTITGLPANAPSGGATIVPSGSVTYTPEVGFAGSDFITVLVDDGDGGTDVTTIVFTVNPQPSLTLTNSGVAVCSGVTTANFAFTGLTNIGPDTLHYTTVGSNSLTIPADVTTLNFDVQGARGGRDNVSVDPKPGYGGRIQGALTVTGGEVLTMIVGGVGGDGTLSGATGGFNGGGSTYFYFYGSGGGGGGASDIVNGGTSLVIAGGGGGAGWDLPGALAGGNGNGPSGGNSAPNSSGSSAGGGTQIMGGAGATDGVMSPGATGTLVNGGNGSTDGISGGGGGGYYGGGGGVWTGGGGGSSYADAGLTSGVTNTAGYDTTNGMITVNFVIPGTYSITWDGTAQGQGFNNVVAGAIPVSPFSITVPAGALPGVYTGTLTLSTSYCTSPSYPITVTINPIPSVDPVTSQAVCNGDSTADIAFSGSVPGATYNWSNNNIGIGLPANGTGHIAKFLPLNGGSAMPVVATITVTPTASGCPGTSTTFTITDNPVPTLSSTLTPPAKCDNVLFSYTPTSASTPGTTYTWSRATIAGITNTGTSGMDNPDETLANTTDTTIPVTYQYVLNFSGCLDTQNVVVDIYPMPTLTNAPTQDSICSGTIFDYAPTTNVVGTNVTWSRATVSGILNGAASGSGDPDEILTDTTVHAVMVTYVDTLNFNGCRYTQNVTVTVDPTPMLSTALNAGSTCDSVLFNYVPNSATSGTAYAWTRDTVVGIINADGNGIGAINETLYNTTDTNLVVTYVYTLTANTCTNVQSVTDTIKPTPMLSSTLTPDSICNNTVFIYGATSGTPGTSFAWVRDSIPGISNPSVTSTTNPVSEILINTTADPKAVSYQFTLSSQGCTNTQYVTVKVEPTPVLNNNPSVATTCDYIPFMYTPNSNTSGVSYSWTRAYVPGIDDFGSSSTGTTGVINEGLNNTTYMNVNVTYHYTMMANGCSNTEDVVLTVHPNPTLSSDSVETVCSGGILTYYPTSYTPTTTFTWSRASVTGITPSINSGSGTMLVDTLTSSLSTLADVVYVYTLTAYGCSNTQDVTVTVNPAPAVPGITTMPSFNSACDNTMYQNFGTSTPPTAGMSYNWIASNGDVYAMGAGNQYCLISFNTPGTAIVYFVVNNVSTGCLNNNTDTIQVSGTSNISPEVIYVNGQFICKTTDVDHYQWGYDDATTFDSSIIAGENNQNYANPNPDASKYYWVMTTHNGCTQKSYYRVPGSTTGVVNVTDQPDIKIYPNPAAESINVEIQSMIGGNYQIEVLNMLGQSINKVTTTDRNNKIDVSGLPAGCYLVDCYHEGVKVATAKFIKN